MLLSSSTTKMVCVSFPDNSSPYDSDHVPPLHPNPQERRILALGLEFFGLQFILDFRVYDSQIRSCPLFQSRPLQSQDLCRIERKFSCSPHKSQYTFSYERQGQRKSRLKPNNAKGGIFKNHFFLY